LSEIGKFACIDCDSSDALSVYEQEDGTYDATCWSICQSDKKKGYKSHNQLCKSYLKEELGIEEIKRGKKLVVKSKLKSKLKKKDESTKVITSDKLAWIRDNSSAKGNKFRGIKDETLKLFNIRTAYDDDGTPSERFYPIYKSVDGKVTMVGCHKRIVAGKDFRAVGLNSKNCMLFGQKEAKGSKRVVLVGGQEDVAAATQMFREWSKNKDNVAPVDFVSSTVGETSCAEQCRANYDFLDSYDEILVDMDNDEAGERAKEALLEVLPVQKTKVMSYNAKDANKALNDKMKDDYIRAIYNAKKPPVVGVLSGSEIFDRMVESLSMPLIPLPPELKPLQDKLCGGLPVGEIINILAASGIGKTCITNMLIKFWIFNSPYKVGILSLEAGAGKFFSRLVSGYLKRNIAQFETPEDKVEFVMENKEEIFELLVNKEGDERFSLIDDNGDLDNLTEAKRTIERLIRQAGCEVIVIDPIQDLLDSLTTEEQAAFIGWQKKLKARDGVSFININHTRKSGGGKKSGSQGGELVEEDMQGTSAIYKSGAVNIIISRDKTAEDVDVRNTTNIMLGKSRDVGDTGPAGQLFYEIKTAQLHNKEDYDRDNSSF
jgi:archaellum biogenesis ATPase FlaH